MKKTLSKIHLSDELQTCPFSRCYASSPLKLSLRREMWARNGSAKECGKSSVIEHAAFGFASGQLAGTVLSPARC